MNQAKGQVTYVGGKPFKGKTLWSFRIGNDDKWFRTGLVDPQLVKGDYIEFFYTEVNGGYNADVSTIHKIPTGTSSVVPGGVGSLGIQGNRGSPGSHGRDTYWEEKAVADKERDLRIQFQSARKDAIALVDILLREKALKLPEKQGAAYDVILGKIKDLTDEFFEDTSKDQDDEESAFEADAQA